MEYLVNNDIKGLKRPWVAYKDGVVYYGPELPKTTRWYFQGELVKEEDLKGDTTWQNIMSANEQPTLDWDTCEVGTNVRYVNLTGMINLYNEGPHSITIKLLEGVHFNRKGSCNILCTSSTSPFIIECSDTINNINWVFNSRANYFTVVHCSDGDLKGMQYEEFFGNSN